MPRSGYIQDVRLNNAYVTKNALMPFPNCKIETATSDSIRRPLFCSELYNQRLLLPCKEDRLVIPG